MKYFRQEINTLFVETKLMKACRHVCMSINKWLSTERKLGQNDEDFCPLKATQEPGSMVSELEAYIEFDLARDPHEYLYEGFIPGGYRLDNIDYSTSDGTIINTIIQTIREEALHTLRG